MGILDKVDVLSTISGGSITGAVYSLHKEGFASFDKKILSTVATRSVERLIYQSWIFWRAVLFALAFLGGAITFLFLLHSWISLVLLLAFFYLVIRFQFRIFPVNQVIEKAYDLFIFYNANIADLNSKPELAIGSTNLQTCRPFTFSQRKMEDSTYAYFPYDPPIRFKHADFPVSRAVMASTCVPYAFTPVHIATEFFENPADQQRCRPVLVDGGVYDNQGVHKITQSRSSYECQFVIASDAGTRLPFQRSYNNQFTLILRTFETFMMRIKNFQMAQHIFQDGATRSKEVAYLSLDWDLTACIPRFISNLREKKIPLSVITAHRIPQAWLENVEAHRTEIQQLLEYKVSYSTIQSRDLSRDDLAIIRGVRTGLSRIPLQVGELLATHAANLTELQVKLYCPGIQTNNMN
jgi:NTE family protein